MSSITTLQLRHTKHSGWYLCSPATWNHKQQKKGLIFKVFARLEAERSNTPTAKLRSPSGVCCSSEVIVCRRPSSCCDTVVTPASLTLSGICYDVTSFSTGLSHLVSLTSSLWTLWNQLAARHSLSLPSTMTDPFPFLKFVLHSLFTSYHLSHSHARWDNVYHVALQQAGDLIVHIPELRNMLSSCPVVKCRR